MKIGTAVLAYNRPKHFKKVIEGIIKEKVKDISVYIDGPENSNIEREQSKIISYIKNFKKKINIKLIRQNKNHGLAFSVLNAIKTEFKSNDAIILIEDDCVPQKGFFKYIYKSLKKYKNEKKIKSICSYNNLNLKKTNKTFLLKRFNPWGWATWRDRWKEFNPDIKVMIEQLYSLGKINKLPLDLKTYCKNSNILQGKEDIWSLSWTFAHYLDDALVLYPPYSLIKNIGFDGSGIHCTKTKVFDVSNDYRSKTISYPKKTNVNLINELKNENFLVQNSSKTFFKNKKLDNIQPYNLLKKTNYLTYDQINYYLERFVFSTNIVDIHTHLYPSKFKNFYKTGLIELLNYHYLTAEFLSVSGFNPKKFYSLTNLKRAKITWNELFLKRIPLSTSTMGILKILEKYEIKYEKNSFNEILKEFNKNNLSENDIFNISGVKEVVMTNNPFDKMEEKIIQQNSDKRYKVSIRLDDLFKNNKIFLKKKVSVDKYLQRLIKNYKPVYFAISTNNFEELSFKNYFDDVLKVLRKFNIPLMILMGVKRNVNTNYKLAGDGLGKLNVDNLEIILRKNPKNVFLVSCLDYSDHFRINVLARKFSNIKIFGYWWFTNQESIIKNVMRLRIEMLNDNFIPQHSDARVIDQLIYKWNDFRNYYVDVYSKKYKQLIETGYRIKADDLEKNVYNHFVEKPAKLLSIKS